MSNSGIMRLSWLKPKSISIYHSSKKAGPSRCPRLTRGVHGLKEYRYPIEEGFGEFLPPAALKTVAIEYQQGILQRLNDEVRGKQTVASHWNLCINLVVRD